MPRSVSLYVDIPRALPPNDPLTGLMGRLLVLRADLEMEYFSISPDTGFDGLDQFDRDYRRLYFVRANSRTLYCGTDLLNHLGANEVFRSWLEREPEIHDDWKKATKIVNRANKEITDFRNHVAAHVGEHIEKGTRALPCDLAGVIEVTDRGTVKPKIAFNILVATSLAEYEVKDWEKEYRRILKAIADANAPFIRATNIAVDLYGRRYPGLVGSERTRAIINSDRESWPPRRAALGRK